jgi:hypothetical protein
MGKERSVSVVIPETPSHTKPRFDVLKEIQHVSELSISIKIRIIFRPTRLQFAHFHPLAISVTRSIPYLGATSPHMRCCFSAQQLILLFHKRKEKLRNYKKNVKIPSVSGTTMFSETREQPLKRLPLSTFSSVTPLNLHIALIYDY